MCSTVLIGSPFCGEQGFHRVNRLKVRLGVCWNGGWKFAHENLDFTVRVSSNLIMYTEKYLAIKTTFESRESGLDQQVEWTPGQRPLSKYSLPFFRTVKYAAEQRPPLCEDTAIGWGVICVMLWWMENRDVFPTVPYLFLRSCTIVFYIQFDTKWSYLHFASTIFASFLLLGMLFLCWSVGQLKNK